MLLSAPFCMHSSVSKSRGSISLTSVVHLELVSPGVVRSLKVLCTFAGGTTVVDAKDGQKVNALEKSRRKDEDPPFLLEANPAGFLCLLSWVERESLVERESEFELNVAFQVRQRSLSILGTVQTVHHIQSSGSAMLSRPDMVSLNFWS